MRTLRIICLAIKYPFSRPRTLPKIALRFLGLAVGALALIGSLTIMGLTLSATGVWVWDSSQIEDAINRRWNSIQSDFGHPISPQWTPDGSAIYIGAGGGRELSTYVVSSDGSKLKYLKYVVGPHVSPDGSRMVYSTWRDTGELSYDIETAKPDGSDRRRLTEDPEYIDIAPSWSPDGSRIAFARDTHSHLDTGTGIYVMAADGSDLRRVYRLRGALTADPSYEEFWSGPVWSPDGGTLAFVIGERSSADGQDKSVLYTIGADGSNLSAVHDSEGSSVVWMRLPAWSPNGGSLAFDYGFPYIVNSDGTGLRKAAHIDSLRSVSWSPDGTRLLLVGYGDSYGRISTYVAEADGGGHRRLGDGFRKSLGAAWSPDGSRIAIVERDTENLPPPQPYLQTMAPDGSDVQVLVEKHERFGGLRAANPADSGWKWPWQR